MCKEEIEIIETAAPTWNEKYCQILTLKKSV
jgi:hypothetical protein